MIKNSTHCDPKLERQKLFIVRGTSVIINYNSIRETNKNYHSDVLHHESPSSGTYFGKKKVLSLTYKLVTVIKRDRLITSQ